MRERILVVNDTQEILDMFRSILEEKGYEAILSAIPFQHVTDIEKIEPDLIIIDMIFGDRKSGWQMLQLLRMNAVTANIPVIVCSAAEKTVREQEGYLASQGVFVVFKPFDLETLLSTVIQARQSRMLHKKEEGQ